jgi:hypothetical protein
MYILVTEIKKEIKIYKMRQFIRINMVNIIAEKVKIIYIKFIKY